MSNISVPPKAIAATVQRSGEYWVLIPCEAGEVAVVNATGYHVFQQCDGARSPADIAHAIAEVSGADIAHVKHDVAAFLASLRAAGLLAEQP
uniref:PqqD family protein n=1 Tax=Pseudonocardia sp. CA-138482 TaxID=3240023 RepID=UPI003F49A540